MLLTQFWDSIFQERNVLRNQPAGADQAFKSVLDHSDMENDWLQYSNNIEFANHEDAEIEDLTWVLITYLFYETRLL